MIISNFKSVTLPILRTVRDCQEYSIQEIITHLYKLFDLSLEDINQLTPDKSEKEMESRIRWGISFLKKTALIMESQQDHVKITESGMKLIRREPVSLDLAHLRQMSILTQYDSHHECLPKRENQ